MTRKFDVKISGRAARVVALPACSKNALAAWARFTDSDTIIGLDIESDAIGDLGAYSPVMGTRLIQFGAKDRAWVLDPHDPRWRPHIETLLADPTKRFVSHNASFDTVRVFHEFGIDLNADGRSIDTLPMAALLWPGKTRQKGLKSLTKEFIDHGLANAEEALHARMVDLYQAHGKQRKTTLLPQTFVPGESVCRAPKCQTVSRQDSLCGRCDQHYYSRKMDQATHGWAWSNIDLDNYEYLLYGGLDALYVRRLLDVLSVMVKRKHMSSASKREQTVRRVMTGISRRGLRVDQEWTGEILYEVDKSVSTAEATIFDRTGYKPRSPRMRDWFATQGINTSSLDQQHLPGLLHQHKDHDVAGPVLQALKTISDESNLLTNLRIIQHHAQQGDGYVHPNINTQQAHTGRMSVTSPAMQTLAKTGEKGHRLRGCFIAREGHTLVSADYDSQEIRIAYALSGDMKLGEVVNEGKNQHVLTAKNIYPEFTDKHDCPVWYHKSKTLDFALQYGAGPKAITEQLDIPVKEAKTLIEEWSNTYSGLVKWTNKMSRKASVRNPYNRLIPADEFRPYANGNFLVQSSGRDVLGEAITRIAKRGWSDWIWLPVHDELVLEVPEDKAEGVAEELGGLMHSEVNGVPITATGEVVGERWGSSE